MKKENELREELLSTIKDIRNLTRLITGSLNLMDRLGRELLKELQSVEGWEIMIESPFDSNDLGAECAVDFSFSDQIIKFMLEEGTVLIIRLDMNIKDQVRQAERTIWERNLGN